MLELVYLKFNYLHYLHWNIWLSTIFYIIGIRIYAHFAPRFVSYDPPVPYWIYLMSLKYAATAWIGAVFGGALVSLYQFQPDIFHSKPADDRFVDLGVSFLFAIITAIIIPKTPRRYKILVFATLATLATVGALFMYSRGWLIYHKWNHLLTVLRYFAPYTLIMIYDRWEATY